MVFSSHTPGPPAPPAEADPRDALVLRLLAGRAGLVPEQVARLCAWWRADGRPAESLADFLTWQRVLSRPTLGLLDRACSWAIAPDRAAALLPAAELARLHNRLRWLREADRLPPSTVTLTLPPAEDDPASGRTGELDLGAEMHLALEDILTAERRPPDPQAGEVLGGRYLLEELIGLGASSRVFRARHRSLDMPVAVKVLHLTTSEEYAGVRQRLREEARLLARLNHPHVVRVYDFDDAARPPYCVLEYVDGWNLADLIGHGGRVRADRAASYVAQAAEGLAAAHALGILHRDVKPGNILITALGTAKLADLGLAVLADEQPSGVSSRVSWEDLAGTVRYMAPEVAAWGPAAVDHRADIYSLGVTFYHAVTGVAPFDGASPWEIMSRHAEEPPVPPHERAPLSPAVSKVILKMMAKNPARRYPDYKSLLADLTGLVIALRLAESGSAADWASLDPTREAARSAPFWKRWL